MKNFLDEQVQLINTPSFIESDPVQFPRRYKRLQDIEIVSFAASAITWGKREMILRNANRMLAKMGDSPYDFVMNEDYRVFGKENIHRTFFEPDLAYMLHGFRKIFSENDGIETKSITYSVGCSCRQCCPRIRHFATQKQRPASRRRINGGFTHILFRRSCKIRLCIVRHRNRREENFHTK